MTANEFIKAFETGAINKAIDNININIINQYVDNLDLNSTEDYEIVRGYLKAFYNIID